MSKKNDTMRFSTGADMVRRYADGWLTYSRSERNRLRRGRWFRNGAIYRRSPKPRERRDRFDRMLATAKRQIARGAPPTVCGSVVEIWDQTVGCPKCGGEAWTRPLEDFDILHPPPWTLSERQSGDDAATNVAREGAPRRRG